MAPATTPAAERAACAPRTPPTLLSARRQRARQRTAHTARSLAGSGALWRRRGLRQRGEQGGVGRGRRGREAARLRGCEAPPAARRSPCRSPSRWGHAGSHSVRAPKRQHAHPRRCPPPSAMRARGHAQEVASGDGEGARVRRADGSRAHQYPCEARSSTHITVSAQQYTYHVKRMRASGSGAPASTLQRRSSKRRDLRDVAPWIACDPRGCANSSPLQPTSGQPASERPAAR